MLDIMTTKELAKCLKLHEITVRKYAGEGGIPTVRIGTVWRFYKDAIDRWISGWQEIGYPLSWMGNFLGTGAGHADCAEGLSIRLRSFLNLLKSTSSGLPVQT